MNKGEVFNHAKHLNPHHEQLLAERGGRIAYAFYRLRGRFRLTTTNERTREDLIDYHERNRRDPVGIIWPEDNMTEKEKDSWRIIGSAPK